MFLERATGSVASLVLRAGEALALRREMLVRMRDTNTPVFLTGDLNDGHGAVTTEVIAGEAPPWVPEGDSAVKPGFWDVELHSAARVHLRRSEHADFTTMIFDSRHETVDHIFFSQEFFYRNRDRVGDLDYVQVLNDHLVDGNVSGAPRNNDASDHGQIVAYFSFVPPGAPTDLMPSGVAVEPRELNSCERGSGRQPRSRRR